MGASGFSLAAAVTGLGSQGSDTGSSTKSKLQRYGKAFGWLGSTTDTTDSSARYQTSLTEVNDDAWVLAAPHSQLRSLGWVAKPQTLKAPHVRRCKGMGRLSGGSAQQPIPPNHLLFTRHHSRGSKRRNCPSRRHPSATNPSLQHVQYKRQCGSGLRCAVGSRPRNNLPGRDRRRPTLR